MANKPRTPAPPRRPVQAPQKRGSKPTRGQDDRSRLMLMLFAGSGIVALVIVVAVLLLARGGGSPSPTSVNAAMKAAGCTVQNVKATGRQHVTDINAKIKYNTTPPSNGNHYYSPAEWGFFTTPAAPVQVVHNEEHGGVIIWWGDKVPQSTIDQLHSFYDSSPDAMVGTLYPSLGNKIALTAWTAPPGGLGNGHVATCSAFNEKAFATFRDTYRGKGPERYPMNTLTPGS